MHQNTNICIRIITCTSSYKPRNIVQEGNKKLKKNPENAVERDHKKKLKRKYSNHKTGDCKFPVKKEN